MKLMQMRFFLIPAVLGAAFSNAALAVSVSSVPSVTNVPVAGYPSFINKGLTVKLDPVQSGANTYYRLTAAGTGTFTFNFMDKQYAGTGASYALTANFNQGGNLISSIGGTALSNKLTIKGAVSGSEAGANPSWAAVTNTATNLWSANLTGFGVNTAKDVLGFKTGGFSGWANVPKFTGGSTAESVYLYDALGLNGFTGALGPIADAFAAGDLRRAPLSTPIAKVQSVATVPVPAAFLLFGSALATLAGFRRKG